MTRRNGLVWSTWVLTVLLVSPVKALAVLKMAMGSAEIANFAARQSPSSTRFVTNKRCPFAQKAWIALEVCGAPYEMKEVALYGSNGKPNWFLELNPEGTVPVLEVYGGAMILPDSDLILTEISNGVVEGGTILKPDNDETSELVDQWRDNVAKLLPIGKSLVLNGGGSRRAQLFDMLQSLENNVVGPFLCGEKITLADCAAFPFLWRLDQEYGLQDDCPKIGAWLSTCQKMDAFSKTIQSAWWWWW